MNKFKGVFWKLTITKGRVGHALCEKSGPWGLQNSFGWISTLSFKRNLSYPWSQFKNFTQKDCFLPFQWVISNPSSHELTHLYHWTLGYDWASIKWGGSESREIYPRKCSKSPERRSLMGKLIEAHPPPPRSSGTDFAGEKQAGTLW